MMARCDLAEWTRALGRAVSAATPHLLVAARELTVAGFAFIEALTADGATAPSPGRERIRVVG